MIFLALDPDPESDFQPFGESVAQPFRYINLLSLVLHHPSATNQPIGIRIFIVNRLFGKLVISGQVG